MPTIGRSGYFTGLPTVRSGKGRAGFNIEIDVQGDAQIEMRFKRVSERSLNLRPAWFAIHEEMLAIERRQFQTEGKYRSGGWAPLADSTIMRKESQGLSTRIMVETERLMRSLTEAGGADHKFVPMASWMLFGSNVPYVGEQMSGVEGRMPARPPIAFNEVDREKFLRIIRGWIMAGSPTETAATERAGLRLKGTLGGDWSGTESSRFSQTLKGTWDEPSAGKLAGGFRSKGSPAPGLVTRPGGRGWATEADFQAWLKEMGLSG